VQTEKKARTILPEERMRAEDRNETILSEERMRMRVEDRGENNLT
jgi:hypothetical protein